MSKCDTVIPIMFAMKKRRDAIHIAAEAIKKLFDQAIPQLVEQVKMKLQDMIEMTSE